MLDRGDSKYEDTEFLWETLLEGGHFEHRK
jgi:hypothetical protein